MKKVVIWIVVLAVVGGAVAGVVWWRQRPAEAPQEVLRTEEVARGDLVLSVAASGNVAVNQATDLVMSVPGRVTEITVAPNDRVEAGEVLARFDVARLERAADEARLALEQAQLELEVEQASADPEELRLAEMAVATAAQALEVARIGTETARIDADALKVQAQRQREQAYMRYRDAEGGEREDARDAFEDAEVQERIAEMNAELTLEQADSQYQTAYTQLQQAQRNLARLQAGPDENRIRQLELQVARAELSLAQAERNLAEAQITAPHAGVVADVLITEGTQQQAGQRAFTLIDTGAYYVEVRIDEIDIGAVSVGQDVTLTLDAYPDTELTGVVERIAPASTNVTGLVAYLVRVRIGDLRDLRVMDRMTATVRIETRTVEDVLLVPNWALRADDRTGQTYVYRVTDGVPLRTDVETGARNDVYTEVTAGLTEGATVGLVTEERSPIPSGPPVAQ